MLMAIGLPAFSRARRHARALVGMSNQRQITAALNLFAEDNNGRYPESVATVGFGDNWNWSDPTKLVGKGFGEFRQILLKVLLRAFATHFGYIFLGLAFGSIVANQL